MDSLTQIVLGGAVAAAIAPPKNRRLALAAGAVLGTLPDLDIIPLHLMQVGPVESVTWHRGPSHSLFVLGIFGWLVWFLLKKYWEPVRAAPRAWFWAMQAALLTHPLLDAFTVYGTQLLWPLPLAPVMWSSVFIVDPLYTLPLLVACFAAWLLRERRAAGVVLCAGLILSTAYLGWTLVAKAMVERTLVAQGLGGAPHFTVPTPFNSLLWRVVVLTPEGFLEGQRSVVADCGPVELTLYPTDYRSLAAVSGYSAVKRLDWFTHGFLKAERRGDMLVLSDMRMGSEPDYIFRYGVARQDGGGGWREIEVVPARWPHEKLADVSALWRRIWRGTCHEAQTH